MELIEYVKMIYQLISQMPDSEGTLVRTLDDTIWVECAGGPYGGKFKGGEAIIANIFQHLGADWQDFHLEPQTFLDFQKTVVVIGNYRGNYLQTGKELDARVVHVWQQEKKKILFEQITDTALLSAAMDEQRE